ncbi:MAG: hypothetical protein A2539_00520 [Elusimicrobia bacterium RIFOXYD2_FULL_34_15]|nr:MAG: hypothetical protein A2539_00520 [Elusimicrobia bacterium RIFOXYD2_FULL_34_15]
MIKCLACGKKLENTSNKNIVKCIYCGNSVILKKLSIKLIIKNTIILKKIALIMRDLKDYDTAIDFYQRTLSVDNSDWDAWLGKAIIYLSKANELESLKTEDLISTYCEIVGIEL